MQRVLTALILFIGFITSSTVLRAQNIDSTMNIYANYFQPEKIHLQFDKGIYNKGETIWFKAYLLAGSDLTPYSKNFYVDWYDAAGKIIKHSVSPIFQSSSKGEFTVPENYTGKSLFVKAYTQWMLNFDTAFLFQREIYINQPKAIISKPKTTETNLQFFPEGGNMINGITCRVAFKAVNQSGIPVFIKGSLWNNKKEQLDSFVAEHDGMGSVSIEPKFGETYYATWVDENGKSGSTNLPAVLQSGASFFVQQNNSNAVVLLERSKEADTSFNTLYLAAYINQNLVYKSRINFSVKTKAVANIPIDELPTGLLQITLFNANLIPVAERIIFVNNHAHEFNVRLTTPVTSTEKRGKNIIELFVPDTAFTNMSLAITDADIAVDKEHTIFSDLLLSGDIKGQIYNPAYYLSTDADTVTRHLDLVLLTNGWRKYNWPAIVKGQLPQLKHTLENEYLQIKGTVYGNSFVKSSNAQLLNVIIQAKDSSKQFLLLPVGKDGKFEQKGLFFYDTVKVYYMFNGDKDKRLTDRTEVKFDNGLLPALTNKIDISALQSLQFWSDSIARLRLKYFQEEQEKLTKLLATTTLKEVTVRARVKSNLELLDEKYTSGLFAGGDSYSFDLSNDVRALGAIDVFTYLQGQVAGLQISNNGGQPTLSWRGATPDLFLDEVKAESDVLQTVPVSNIAYIKVFRPPFFGAIGGGSGGAIAVYTKRGSDGKVVSNSPGLPSTILGGYTRYKEFYSPNYDVPPSTFEPDLRTTLYWNPYILTNKKSPKVKLEFFNNDVTKKMRLILEGINGDGKMIRVEKIIE